MEVVLSENSSPGLNGPGGRLPEKLKGMQALNRLNKED